MNSSDYSFGIFLLIMTVISSLLLAAIYLLLGSQMFFQDFFISYFILGNAISFAGIAIMAKYFYHKGYKLAFLSFLLSALATLVQMAVLYMMIVERKFGDYYFQAVIFLLFASLLLGGALVFSKSSERKWLKTAGILILITSGLLLVISFLGVTTQNLQSLVFLEKISKWISLGTTLIPILLALNFQGELNSNPNSKSKIAGYTYGILGLLFILSFLTISIPFTSSSYSKFYWQGKNQEKADQLVELFDDRTFVGNNEDSLQYLLL